MNITTKSFAVLISIFLLSSISTYGCLNPIGQSFIGQKIKIEDVSASEFIKNFTTHKSREYWEDIRKQNSEHLKKYPQMTTYSNNLAVALVHLGNVREAIKILEDLEKSTPNFYATASNLGTAYELSDDNQKALEWIKKAISRDNQSHFGTEWLHVKILEAKIAAEKDSDWIKNHSVLGVNLDTEQNLPTDHLGQKKTFSEVEDALLYQLHERLEFVNPPEPIVGDLLSDLSKIFTLRSSSDFAKVTEELADKYKGSSAKTENTPVIYTNDSETRKYYFYGVIGAIVFFAILIFYFLLRRNRSVAIK